MTDQLKSVCEQLDNLAIEYIEEADAISNLKQNIGNEMAKVLVWQNVPVSSSNCLNEYVGILQPWACKVHYGHQQALSILLWWAYEESL